MNKIDVKSLCACNIGVDSGTILIADSDFYKSINNCQHEIEEKDYYEIRNVETGIYEADCRIEESWNGLYKACGRIIVTSGKLVISDPCYIIEDDLWQPLLIKTAYLSYLFNGTLLLDGMGGDGSYDVEIKLKKVADYPPTIGDYHKNRDGVDDYKFKWQSLTL
jgi:hypothetical protein